MKRSFLLIFTFVLINSAFSQVIINKPQARDLKPNENTDFKNFYDRLRISWLGVATTPTFRNMEKGRWSYAAISPEFTRGGSGDEGNEDTYATNIFNQISFNYNFGAKLNFIFNPRFTVFLAEAEGMAPPEDPGLIALEDFVVGFQGVIFSSADKKFNLWIQPAVRLPTSKPSRGAGNGGRGTTTHQLTLGYSPTYDFDKTWQIGIFGQVRDWVAEDSYNYGRIRFYTAPYVQYTIDDTSRVQVYYENMIENQNRWKSQNGKEPLFQDYWQNVMVGYNKDITPKFNVFPFVGAFVNDVPFSNRSVWLGAWMTYQIK
jgi:hypothetical protein